MKTIEHTIDIDAPADTVWHVLTDFAAYTAWNPFITIAGSIGATGDRPRITIKPGKRTMTFRPTVTRFEAGRFIAWLGRFGLPRVFDGAHELRVEVLGGGRSRFTQRETFRGVLVPMMRAVLRDTDRGFEAMNTALAQRAVQLRSVE